MALAIVPYTTSTAIQKTLSATGVSLRDDDDATGLTQAIADASVEVEGYCLTNYTQSGLAASNWIEKKCRDIAVFHLCTRRGNPAPQSVQVKYEKAIEDLEKVQAGKFRIADIAERKESVPVLSNQRVRNSPVPLTVTETGRSTGDAEGYTQNIDQNEQYFDYGQRGG